MNQDLRELNPIDERHLEWRSRFLRGAGFPPAVATRIAAEPTWDLHALLKLVDRGCPPHLAERILAPLDWERGPR